MTTDWLQFRDAPSGTFWYMDGAGQIGTWNPITSGTITFYYEGLPATQTVDGSDADLGFPDDWYDTLAAMVVEQILQELGQRSMPTREWAELLNLQKATAMGLKRELASNRERQNYTLGIPDRMDY